MLGRQRRRVRPRSSASTRLATSVPNSSIACITSRCETAPMLMWAEVSLGLEEVVHGHDLLRHLLG